MLTLPKAPADFGWIPPELGSVPSPEFGSVSSSEFGSVLSSEFGSVPFDFCPAYVEPVVLMASEPAAALLYK